MLIVRRTVGICSQPFRTEFRNLRILLTGGSGLLGTALARLEPDLVAPPREELDVTDGAGVREYISRLQPDVVVHAAAATRNRDIDRDPSAAIATNIVGTANIVQACLKTRIRLVYLSTDYVYPGDAGPYAEASPLLPFNAYAWTKLAGEAAVRTVPNHLVIRTSFGAERFVYPEAFSDKLSSKEYVDVIAPDIFEAAISPLTGVLNIGGAARSIYDYARQRSPDVKAITRWESPFASPADTRLDTSRWNEYRQGGGVVQPVRTCRMCGSAELQKYLDLGMMPLANNLAPGSREAREMHRFPMQVQYCNDCSLSQLTVVVDPREMFSHYAYRSSVSQGYVRHCREMAVDVGKRFGLSGGDLVIDIAGNDGTLLAEFRDVLGVNVVNIDPAENISAIAESRGIPTINDYWSTEVAETLVSRYGKPKLATATNVFAHVHDVRGFMLAAKRVLHDDGALMLEFPYAVDFIENREFDTIYFEHLSYVLIRPLARLAADTGMEVFDVEKQDIHGGTVRVFLALQGQKTVASSVGEFLAREQAGGFHEVTRYLSWADEVDALIGELGNRLTALRAGGAKIAAFGASAKGNTLLNACRLDQQTIDYIVDDTPEKIGRFSPGNGVPIVSRQVLDDDPPEYLLILAWNFAREIMDNTGAYAGKYIIPIPGYQEI